MSETEELDPGQPRRRTNSRVMADAWKAWKDEQLSTTELEVQMIGLAANADLLQAKLTTAERRLEAAVELAHIITKEFGPDFMPQTMADSTFEDWMVELAQRVLAAQEESET